MGLDNFMDDSSGGSTTSKTTSSTSTNNSKSQEPDNSSSQSKDTGPYKVIRGRGRNKVIRTEEEWEEVKTYIQETLDINFNEVMHLDPSRKYEFFHRAILGSKGSLDKCNVEQEEECVVCEHTFEFPTDWEYMEYKGNVVCPGHTFKEVKEAAEEADNGNFINYQPKTE